MLVTEDDARRLWCPAGRLEGNASNRTADGWVTRESDSHPPSACVAGKCMWWRWADKLTESLTPVRVHQGGRLVDLEHRRGYCGMAGTP